MGKKICKGDCIFCTLKCPECGSTEVSITYSPTFTCNNDTKNSIRLYRDVDVLELSCQACDTSFESGNAGLEDDDRLDPLILALIERFDLPIEIEHRLNEDHVVETFESRAVIRDAE